MAPTREPSAEAHAWPVPSPAPKALAAIAVPLPLGQAGSVPEFDQLGVAMAPLGLQAPSVWFGGGRIGVHVERYGTIEEMVFYGAQPIDRNLFFKTLKHSPYQRIFCPYLVIGERCWQLELERTRIYPAGYVSHLDLPSEGVWIRHALIIHDDAAMYRIEVLRNDAGKPLQLRLALHEYTRHLPQGRIWGETRDDLVPGALTTTITDPARSRPDAAQGGVATTWFGVVGSVPISARRFQSGRCHYQTAPIGGSVGSISLIFGSNELDFRNRCEVLGRGGPEMGADRIAGWDRCLRDAPSLSIGQPVVESFFRQSGLITDMLSPVDLPGGMRAAVGHYWIWGWDTMVHGDSYLVNGRSRFVHHALELYRRTADPALGIGHQFNERMEILIPQALPAQGLYMIMLQQYLSWTGDASALTEFYPFARTIFQRTCAQRRHRGLSTGIALFPDFPQFAGEIGGDRDISVFNNGIFYQAARSMEHLAGLAGDAATAMQAREGWLELEQSFRDLLWDGERGYWFDSIDSVTWAPRRSYPAHAILWTQGTAGDLVAGREEACADFLSTHHACLGGIRMYPLWDAAFNGDGNQLGQYYPAGVDMFFLRLMARTGRQDMLRRWLGWVDLFYRQYTVPEGVTLEAENDGPHRPDCPGGKQPFTVKPWHMALINAIVGVDFDHGGITIGPGLDDDLRLDRIRHRESMVSIHVSGAGTHVGRITINGRPLTGSCKIPADHCPAPAWQIDVVRQDHPSPEPWILSADGATLTRLETSSTSVRVHLEAPGSVRVRLRSATLPLVSWSDQALACDFDPITGQGSVLLLASGTPIAGVLAVSI